MACIEYKNIIIIGESLGNVSTIQCYTDSRKKALGNGRFCVVVVECTRSHYVGRGGALPCMLMGEVCNGATFCEETVFVSRLERM